MATSSPLLGHVIIEKLTKTNYNLWKAQVLLILRSAHIQGYLNGTEKALPREIIVNQGTKETKKVKEPHLEYARWSALEQQVLGFLFSSMTRDVMAQVASCITPYEVRT